MSAEILRRAASLMCERAEAATPGPWRDDLQTVVTAGWWVRAEGANAAHIAALHPDVALAMASLLSMVANHAAGWGDPCGGCVDQALTLARTYLGEDS